MPGDSGFFQLNDIVLNIPPEQINVVRSSANHQWQTLRTRSSIKSKSGYSNIEIAMTCTFTNHLPRNPTGLSQNGFEQLRDLIAQFRVTPFAYVENQYLRNAVLGGSPAPNMVLALKQMQITKGADEPNVIQVMFRFAWFNYFPYMREWLYKTDFFSPTSHSNPAASRPWQTMYAAELQRGAANGVYAAPPSLNDKNSKMEFNQFATLKVSKYLELEKDYFALLDLDTRLRQLQQDGGDADNLNVSSEIAKTLSRDLTAERAKVLTEDVFGNATSQTPEKFTLEQAIKVLDSTLAADSSSQYILPDQDIWHATFLNNGRAIIATNNLTASRRDIGSANGDDILLLERRRSLSLDPDVSGLIVTGITISFENILAVLPLVGHPYPTYQHMGSTDAVVSLSVTTTNESSLSALSGFYSTVEDQAMKFKTIPQGHRNVQITNDLINMCGLKDFIPNALVTSTAPGQPGTYHASLELVNNPLDANTREKIAPSPKFASRMDIRNSISDILLNNLAFDASNITESGVFTRSSTGFSLAQDVIEAFGADAVPTNAGTYRYAPKSGSGADGRNAAFRDLCEEYGRNMTQIIFEMVKNSVDHGSSLREFFSLTNDDVPGIERMQQDVHRVVKKFTRTRSVIGNRSLEDTRADASAAIDRSREIALKNIQDFENLRRSQGLVNSTQGRAVQAITEAEEENYNRLKNFVNDFMNEWLNFAIPFLDRILYSGFIDLDQFANVKKQIAEMVTTSSGTCYPDFPLDQVVNVMENSDGPAIQQAVQELRNAANKGDLGLKNIGIAALLQPDFYLYSTQGDELENILPHRMTRAAADAILEGQAQSKPQIEKSWLRDYYEPNVVGTELSSQIRRDANDISFDTSFWEAKADSRIQEFMKDLQRQTEGDFHFYDLLDMEPQGLGCSILTENQTEGSLPLHDINLGGAFTNDGDRRVPGSMVHRNRSGAQLKPDYEHHGKVRHKFGVNSIQFSDTGGPPATIPAASQYDPNKDPEFILPVLPGSRVSSFFGPRMVEGLNAASRNHGGLDLVTGFGRNSTGDPVYAAADGWIINARATPWDPATQKKVGPGNFIAMQHANGFTTSYLHLNWEGETVTFSERFHAGGKKKIFVKAGTTIGRIGTTGGSTGPHLHFTIKKNNVNQDPVRYIGQFLTERDITRHQRKNQGPLVGVDPVNESLLVKSVQQLEKDLKNGQGYSLLRAYPTFRLYFIESDMGERRRFGFDDFFSYSSVQDITVIRSRKIPADLAVITLTNVSGALSNRKFKNSILRDATGNVFRGSDVTAISGSGEVAGESVDVRDANTIDENPIASLMLRPGVQIQLRMGYSNHPDELETVMNGVITDVQFTETDDMVQISCQSFAIEMVQNQHGDVKSFGGFWDGSGRTGKLLEELMALPEMVHFGRWEGGKATNTAYGLLRNEWNFVPSPQDDNIFAPKGRGIWGLFDSTPEYILYQNTVWDVFQEMTLRHPAYVAYPVPYEGKWGPRMTMFFGLPDQQYFARDPTFKEDNKVQGLAKFVADSVESLRNSRSDIESVTDPNKSPIDNADKVAKKLEQGETPLDKARAAWLKNQVRNYALDQGFIKPFRNYHIATSTQHILMNNIQASGNVFNTVTLQYGDEAASVESGEITFGDLETFTLRADASVQDEEVREMFAQYHNCVGYEMAKRYSLSLLFYSMKENYKGNLVIIGNPKIKPYDIVYVFDEYSDMFGPIEVEQVVHRMSMNQGFVTEITPDMVVHVNQESTLSTSDAMGLMAENALRRIGLQSLPSMLTKTNQAAGAGALAAGSVAAAGTGATVAAAAAAVGASALAFNIGFTPVANLFFNSSEHALSQGASTSPFGMMGAFIFKKLITRSQLAHPFRYSPLVKGGQAMVAGLPIHRNKGSFVQDLKEWAQEADEGIGMMLNDLYEDLSPNNWFGRSQGNLVETVLGR